MLDKSGIPAVLFWKWLVFYGKVNRRSTKARSEKEEVNFLLYASVRPYIKNLPILRESKRRGSCMSWKCGMLEIFLVLQDKSSGQGTVTRIIVVRLTNSMQERAFERKLIRFSCFMHEKINRMIKNLTWEK